MLRKRNPGFGLILIVAAAISAQADQLDDNSDQAKPDVIARRVAAFYISGLTKAANPASY